MKTFVNFQIEEEIYRLFKSNIALEGKKIGEVLSELVEEYNNKNGSVKKEEKRKELDCE